MRWPLRAACTFTTTVGASGRPPSVRPSLVRARARSVLISGRKRPSGRPRSTAGRLLRSGRFLQMHVFTHNEHPSCGLSDTSLRSRPIVLLGRPLLRRRCQDPARPDPPKTNRNRMRRAVRPRAETRQPSPAPGSLRRSSHFGSRSAPSRAALLAWLMAASFWAFPLDRALCGRPAASVAERRSETGRHY